MFQKVILGPSPVTVPLAVCPRASKPQMWSVEEEVEERAGAVETQTESPSALAYPLGSKLRPSNTSSSTEFRHAAWLQSALA